MARSCLIRRGFPNRRACQDYLRRLSNRVRHVRSPLGKAENRVSTGTKTIMANITTALTVEGMGMRASHRETATPQTVSGMAARTGGESSRPTVTS